MMSKLGNEYREHDALLSEAREKIKLLELTFPLNEQEEKRVFFQDSRYEPQFTYKKVEYDFGGLATRLAALDFEADDLGTLYDDLRKTLLDKIEITRNRGNREIVVPLSKGLFGEVDQALYAYAREILSRPIEDGERTLDISPTEAKTIFEKYLKQLQLDDWRVELSPRFITSVIVSRRTIALSRHRFFSSHEIERLVIHEIGVHVIRAANGFRQPYGIFSIGTPWYESTEEGTAVYIENQAGMIDESVMRNYAGRVVAVKTVFDGWAFKDTFDEMKEAGFSDNEAWQLSVRTHRAGGLAKDHIYLKGFFELKTRFKDDRSDLPYLFTGKIGIGHLELVKRLISGGVLREPKYVHDFLGKFL
ncbi:MAG: DUF1704 domain-containing protein [bacterium]|jgi:uncharacterized protein (TIGR02421 family)|nr:DUF1704 domain-containing protein [bacterium]